MEKEFRFSYIQHKSVDALNEADQELLQAAEQAAERAYAPYSNFHVGAALRLADGTVVTGNNQENASFPAGTCAERTALHAAMSLYPAATVTTMAILVKGQERPVSPCGVCRQALMEQRTRQQVPLRLLLGTSKGPVLEVSDASSLLPLAFDGSFLQG